ncbi:hypothetical protein CEXT_625761 [Caerostris extrusa]|uniref:Uncharacterized protein n=1 Tax=Caerostris extrusa TaxID=172846 RepID=A0AAV4M9N4_CAEEX|nr:hypothetical protein CEXT_625761 [Caerostris extrusa]
MLLMSVSGKQAVSLDLRRPLHISGVYLLSLNLINVEVVVACISLGSRRLCNDLKSLPSRDVTAGFSVLNLDDNASLLFTAKMCIFVSH